MEIQNKKIGVVLILLGIVLLALNHTGSQNGFYDEFNNVIIFRREQPTFAILSIAIGILMVLYINDSSVKEFTSLIIGRIRAKKFSIKNKKIGFSFLIIGLLLFIISINLFHEKPNVKTGNLKVLKEKKAKIPEEDIVIDSSLINSSKRPLSPTDLRQQEEANAFYRESAKKGVNLVNDPGFTVGKVYSEAQDDILSQGLEKSNAEYQEKFRMSKAEKPMTTKED